MTDKTLFPVSAEWAKRSWCNEAAYADMPFASFGTMATSWEFTRGRSCVSTARAMCVAGRE